VRSVRCHIFLANNKSNGALFEDFEYDAMQYVTDTAVGSIRILNRSFTGNIFSNYFYMKKLANTGILIVRQEV